MAFSQTDLDTLRAAIASGIMRVRYADGREVTYQSADAMLKAEQRIMDSLAFAPGSGRRRRRAAAWRNGC
ncbi:phage head-tail joining protein [Sphingomonas sp. BK580]|uniref:phage head-tail joining protein n=1 Tax=Sphingomonas sp. BK580 TaxID=2586972 RepID=UPI0016109C04|nr:hypothetical protein [Sphingomonas sp. BK580]MBB3691462.1 hypothetical protein [Sphingomonas sp. BK580]